MECLKLRVKDIDFSLNQITVVPGKGDQDRVTMLPVVSTIDRRLKLQGQRSLHLTNLRFTLGLPSVDKTPLGQEN